jgi:hypothetical protein
MAEETKEAWERFQADMKGLGSELRRHYRDSRGDEKKSAELNRTLEQLRAAADAVFDSVETASRDPQIHSRTRDAARSFGSALAQTFREVGEELDKALRTPTEKK